MDLLNRLTIKNLKLNKKRTIVTIIGIMLSVALITAVASVYTSGVKSIMKYEANLMGDFHVGYLDVDKKDLSVIGNNKGIKDYYLVRNMGYAKIANKNEYKPYAYLKAFSQSALDNLSITLQEGELPKNSDEILIPSHLKTNGRLELKVGESITLDVGNRYYEGEILDQYNPYTEGEELKNTESHTYKIVGIIDRPASNIENYSAPGYTFVTYGEDILDSKYDVYTKYTKDGLKKLYDVTGNILGIDGTEFKKCSEPATAEKLDDAGIKKCEDLFRSVKYNTVVNEYLIALETDPLGGDIVTGLKTMAIVIIIIIVVTSVFCIKNSFDISITEKIKQYGMLRSIGSTKKQIKKNVYFEATILGIIGIPLGLLLGFLASFILMCISDLFTKDLTNIELSFSFSYIAALLAIILGVVTVYLSALSSAHKASKVSPIDSIRNSANIKINSKKIKAPKFIEKVFGVGGVISYKNLKRNKKKYRTTVISIIVSVFTFIALSSFMDIIFRSIKEDFKTNEYNLAVFVGDPDTKLKGIVDGVLDDSVKEYSYTSGNSVLIENPKYTKEYLDLSALAGDVDINVVALDDSSYRKYIKELGVKYDDIKDKVIMTNKIRYEKYEPEAKKKYVTIRCDKFDYKVGDIVRVKGADYFNIEIGALTDIRPFGYKLSEGQVFIIVNEEYFNKHLENMGTDVFIKTSSSDKLQDNFDKALSDYQYEIYNSDQNYKKVNNLYTLVAIFMYGFIIVISLIGITNIFNTITTNMELRKREFAMLKSVGMTKKEFNRMIRLESMFMGFKSLAYGIIIGLVLSYLVFKMIDQDILTYHLPIKGIIISVVIVLLLISLIMKYSISKINKQNTIETIRNENI